MKKIELISVVIVCIAYHSFAQEISNHPFVVRNNTVFLEGARYNSVSHNNAIRISLEHEDDDEQIKEYDAAISVHTKPVPLSFAKRCLAELLGKLLIYYFALRDRVQEYYKKYKNIFYS